MKQKKYEKYYSETKFWDKIQDLSTTAPFCTLLKSAISLYLLLKEPSVSVSAKLSIVFALGYFICPIDLIPDFAPMGIGLTDDMAIMAAVLSNLYSHLTHGIQEKVQKILPEICRNQIEFDPETHAKKLDPKIGNEIKDLVHDKSIH